MLHFRPYISFNPSLVLTEMRLGPKRTDGPATSESRHHEIAVTVAPSTIFLVQLDKVEVSVSAPCLIN